MGEPGGRRILGLDEAGRGSFLGPLVVGAFLVPESRLPDLVEAGARDSKELTPAARERAYAALIKIGSARSVALPPAEVDRHVRRRQLNQLEAKSFAGLIRELDPDVTYVDACDPNAGRFGRHVAALAGTRGEVIARHKADRDLPVVGAASIVAKVRRDRAVAELSRRLGTDVGSGYPSDPATVDFVRAILSRGERPPRWLRASWSTMQRVMPRPPARPLEEFSDDRRGGARLRR